MYLNGGLPLIDNWVWGHPGGKYLNVTDVYYTSMTSSKFYGGSRSTTSRGGNHYRVRSVTLPYFIPTKTHPITCIDASSGVTIRRGKGIKGATDID